jgi:alpha-tubulin suppressor-like RCC1 family protein
VATSSTHSLAITTLDTVQCTTGFDDVGQCDVSSWKDIKQVAAGTGFSVAIDFTGTVYFTGLLYYGVYNISALSSAQPISYIAAGPNHILGIKESDSSVVAAGRDSCGQTSVSSWTDIIQVDGGTDHSLGLKKDGTVVCAVNDGGCDQGQCEVSNWSSITQISAGAYFSLGIDSSDSSVEFAGLNTSGQGNVSGWANVKNISAGYNHTVAVNNNNEPMATGLNDQGQCDTSSWTVIGDVVAGDKTTIGVLVTGELTAIGDTDNASNDVSEWQLINNPPVAVSDSISVYEDYSITTDDLYSQATDYESHSLTVITSNPSASNGTVDNHGDGTYTYSPTTDFNGSDSFTYTITDSQTINYTGTAVVSIDVTPVNDAPYYIDSNIDCVTEDSGPQSISAWARSLTTGAYNEGSQSLSITWTCSDESLFLTAPVISPVTVNTSGDSGTYAIDANTSDLTLTYTFDEDQYGSVTLTVILYDDGGLDYLAYGAADTTTRTYVIEALSVNDAPTFTKGSNLFIYEDATAQEYTQWATNLYEGAIKETEQTLAFTVTNNYPTMFSTEPSIAVNGTYGTLSYTLTADMWGDVTAIATLWDDGGTANGGEYTVAETFVISITPVNDPPDFTIGPDRTILEGSSETYTSWATDLTVGAIMETDQSLAFSVTTSCSECFISEPVIYTATGDMCYTLAAEPFGMVTVWVTLTDSGGTPNGGDDNTTHSFTISITDVNDQPSFSLDCYSITVLEDATYTGTTRNGYATSSTTITAFATDITPANDYETNQSLIFSLTNTNSSMFTTQPDIYTATGDLSYTLTNDENGVVTITVTLTDDGGTNYGGVDTYTDTFVLNVTPVNDPPTMTTLGDQSVLEDDGSICVSDWATSISKGATNETAQVLTFDFTSDNPDLFISGPSMVYTQSGTIGDLCYTLNANEFGAATVTMVVYDDAGTENGGFDRITETFEITVIALNDTPTITTISDQTIVESSSTGPLAFTIGDIDADALTVTVASSDTTLISDTHITFGDTNANSYTIFDREAFESIPLSITVTPIPGRVGTATITITVFNGNKYTRAEDGVDYTTTTFDVTVDYVFHDGPGGIGSTDGTSSLKLWLKADQITGLSHGQTLTSWVDQSGYSHTMNISNTPSYSSAFSNDFPAVEFDGSTDALYNASALDFFDAAGMSVFSVINATNTGSTRSIISRDASGDRGWGGKIDHADHLLFSVAHSSSEAVTRTGASAISDSFTIVSYLYDGLIGRSINVYNGETDDSDALEYSIPYLVGASGPALRIGNDGDNNYFQGSIAELIVFDRHVSTVGRILIDNYLSSKYDIALSSNDMYTGDTNDAGNYDLDVSGIGLESDSINSVAISSGMIITNTGFLTDVGDYLLIGNNRESNTITLTHLPSGVFTGWERSWMLHITDINNNDGTFTIEFDRSGGDMSDLTLTTDMVLLKRSHLNDTYEIMNTLLPTVIGDDRIQFSGNGSYFNTGDYLTLGSQINSAIEFNGSSDHYLVSEAAIDLSSQSFTIEFWARRKSTGVMYLVGQGPETWGDNTNLNISFSASDHLIFGIDATDYTETTAAYTDTNWHHYAFVYDNGGGPSVTIYVDGEQQLTESLPSYSGNSEIFIGKAPGKTDYFYGEIDEIRIWTEAKSYADLFSKMNVVLQGDETNLNTYWQLNEGASTIAYDKTATGINLSLTPTNDLPRWIVSSLPIGYSSAAQTETMGVVNFTDTNLTMDFHHQNGETVVATMVTTNANVVPTANVDILSAQYWIISRTGNTTFNADMTFTMTDENAFTESTASVAKLFWRENGDTGAWEAIAYGSSIDDTTETITFNGIQTTGQFMVAFDNYASTIGSGYALDFDGADDFAINEADNITLTDASFSIEFWAKRASTGTKHSIIGQSDDSDGLCIGFTANNTFVFSFNAYTVTSGAYTDTQWHHWAVTFDATGLTQTVYCDGVWITENVASAAYTRSTKNFYIGCGPNQQDPFEGQIDEIRVWNDVRNLVEIQSNMYLTFNGDGSGLQASWLMDEPWSYTYITDATSNSNNCVVTNTMLVSDWVVSTAFAYRTIDEDSYLKFSAGYDIEGDNLSVSSPGPNSGTVTTDAEVVTYTPDTNVNGTDTFNVVGAGQTYPITVTIVPINDAPEIGTIPDDTIGVNATSSVGFTITDIETDPDSLTLTPTSSNQAIVDDSNITISCAAGTCTATTTPETDASGVVQITITVTDPEGLTANNMFGLTINESPTIGSISNYSTTVHTATSPIAFTISDTETAEDELDLTLTSSNSDIIGITNASFTQDASGDCTITLTPTSNGTVTINIIVTDATSFSATTSFDLVVNTMPEIETIADYTTAVNTAISIPFKVTDADSAESSLELTITSSDSGILPLSQTLLTNSNGDCTATLTPTSSNGAVTLEITVTDTDGYYTSTSFVLNVNNVPEISNISDYTISQNTDIPSFNFTITDETEASQLSVTFTSSDESIIPSAQIVETNDGIDSYTLTITPLANTSGAVTITVLAVDSNGYSSTNLFVINIVTLPGSGNMLTFNGLSDYAKSGDTLSLSGDHTVEAWIKPDNHSSMGCVTSLGMNSGKYSKLLITDSEKIAVDILQSGGMLKSYTASTLSTGEWVHVAYIYQSNTESLTIYVNGIPQTSTIGEDQAISPFTLSAVPVYIGKDQGSSYFDGSIDEIRIWNDVRTEEEIRDFMCEKAYTSTTDDLVAYYRFDHNSGTTLMYDWTGSGNSCDLTGATLETSEATIGDDSEHDYSGIAAGDFTASLAHSDGDNFTMIMSNGVPDGIHLYMVNQSPNSISVDTGVIKTDRYWGVFITGSFDDYELKYEYTQNSYAETTRLDNALARRDNNADMSWILYVDTEDTDIDGLIDTSSIGGNNDLIYEFILQDTEP